MFGSARPSRPAQALIEVKDVTDALKLWTKEIHQQVKTAYMYFAVAISKRNMGGGEGRGSLIAELSGGPNNGSRSTRKTCANSRLSLNNCAPIERVERARNGTKNVLQHLYHSVLALASMT